MVDQHIPLLQAVEQRLAGHQLLGPTGLVGLETHAGRVHHVDELVHAHEVDGTVRPVQRLFGQAELGQQKVGQEFGAACRDFQANGLAEMPVLQTLAQSSAQVFDFFLVHRQIRVPGHTELRKLRHMTARKQVLQMRADQAGDGHEQLLLRSFGDGQTEKTRQLPRDFDNGHLVFAAESVPASEADDEVERLVGHLRKRMRRVEPHRHQQRLNLVYKPLAHPAPLADIALAVRNELDATLFQRGHQRRFEDVVLLINQLVNALGQGPERGIGVRTFFVAHGPSRHVCGRANFEKLVQVGRHDAQVTQPFQQGYVGTRGPIQHAGVERKDALVAVQQFDRGGWRQRAGGRT